MYLLSLISGIYFEIAEVMPVVTGVFRFNENNEQVRICMFIMLNPASIDSNLLVSEQK